MDTSAGWINRELNELKRQLRELRAAKGLEASTIGKGGLTIKGEGGLRLVAADGRTTLAVVSNQHVPDPDGNPQPMVHMRRADGTLAMSLDDPLPDVDGYRQIFRLWDRSGNEILAEDATSGQGLANPWVPMPLYPARYTDWPKSTSGSYETIYSGMVRVTNPRLTFGASFTSDDPATSGQVRVTVNDVQVGSAASFGFAIGSELLANGAALPAGVQVRDNVVVRLQVRRTAGAGNVMAVPYLSTGSQSL